ncbi:MAG: GyrI-like domain-containing protein [Rhizobacter sp.]
MKTTDPVIEQRSEQPYVGIRMVMPMSDFPRQIPTLTDTVADWLAAHHTRPAGKPFLRYHVIDMPKRMDVEVGIPVDAAPQAEPPLESHVLPAGRYAVLTYQGVKNGVPANKKLLDWVAAQGEAVASHDSAQGEAFKARYETFLIDDAVEPDQDKWETEVAMKLRD